MQPTRKTQPHRRGQGTMAQGPVLAAMLRGAGSMGNPQDAVREATKRAFKRGTLGNAGIADGGDAQLGAPGLPPHSGASGLAPHHLALLLRQIGV